MSGLVAVRYAVTHTGAVITNDALPIATDRPMAGSAVVHKLPPAPGWRWATPNAP